jgi:uncharacterized Tic20 family protein
MSEGNDPVGDRAAEKVTPAVGESSVLDNDAKLWGTLCHLSALSAYVTVIGGIAGPLIVWLVKRNEIPFVEDQGKEALNFQISMFLYHVIAAIGFLCVIGIPVFACLTIANIVLVIVASYQANNGVYYRYPLTIRFIK